MFISCSISSPISTSDCSAGDTGDLTTSLVGTTKEDRFMLVLLADATDSGRTRGDSALDSGSSWGSELEDEGGGWAV